MTDDRSQESALPTPAETALARLQSELAPRLRRASVPIYGWWKGRQVLDRTSVFVRIQNEHFLLTAAHGQLNEKAAQLPLAIGWDEDTASRILLHDFAIHKSSNEQSLDVAVIDLPSDVSTRLCKHYQPILLCDIDQRLSKRPGIFILFGYPEQWANAERSVDPTSVFLMTERYAGEFDPINPEIRFEPRAHIPLQFSRDSVNLQTGGPLSLPNMSGISGCGIWRVADDLDAFINSFQPQDIKLVAIQNVWHGGMGYAVGTWAYYAVEILFQSHPRLRQARNLIYPQ